MSRAGGRSAPRLAALLGAALVAVALLAAWLARQAGDEPRTPTVEADAAPAADRTAELPVPAFAVEPAAVEGALADGADAATDGDPSLSHPEPLPADRLRLLVVHSDGTPAAGAAVVLAASAGEVVIGTWITRADGRVSGAITGDGQCDIYVGGATLTPQRFEIELAAGEQRLELADGAFVGGVALVDGQPPAEPLELVLVSRDDDDAWAVPYPVGLALRTAGEEHGELGQHTTDGRFLFGGLPRDWAGWIHPPDGYRMEAGVERELFVPAPSTDVVLRLTWDGALTGRVLLPGSTAESVLPAREATLSLRVDRAGSTMMRHAATDQEGRFHLPLYSNSPLTFSLQLRAADGTSRRTVSGEGLDPFVVHDLGDIVLEPTGSVEFLVRDEAGRPLAGAVATALDETRARSQPTGADGRGVLSDLMPGTTALRFDALGRHPTEVEIAPPIEVVLPLAPALDLTLVDANGAAALGLVLSYEAEAPLFDGAESAGNDLVQVSLGATRFDRFWRDGARGDAILDDRARFLLTRIRAGVPFTLAVRDGYGTGLRPPERLILAPGEQRQLEWTVSGSARTVTVHVLTTEGDPVPGARVWLRGSGPAGAIQDRTFDRASAASETGEVTFPGVFAERVSLQASAERLGLGTAWLLDQHVPPEAARFELRLAPGRTIDIEVVGADGTRRRVDDVSMIDGPVAVSAEPVEEGVHRLTNAPPGTITLRALLGRRRYTARHETSQPRARIEIPALGSLSARWTMPLQADQTYTVQARCLHPDDWSRYFVVHDRARPTNGPIGFGDLLPGEYEVVLCEGLGWTGENPAVSQVARVMVKAGEVTEVLLEP